MPFQSEKQRRYMHANLPVIANRWEKKYGLGGVAELNAELNSLPEYYLPFPAAQGGRIGFEQGSGPMTFQEYFKGKSKFEIDKTREEMIPIVEEKDGKLDQGIVKKFCEFTGMTEKEFLISQLREMLEQTSRKTLMEQERDEAQALQEKLQKVPYPIYIG